MSLPYRENVCLLIYNADYQLFLGERIGESGLWQFPQGGVETGLSLEQNALKEAHEELGADLDKFEISRRLLHTHKYDFDKPPAYALKCFRGQSQTFWMLKFKGTDCDINLEQSDKEFQNWKWAEPQEVHTIVETRRVAGYLPAIKEFLEIVTSSINSPLLGHTSLNAASRVSYSGPKGEK